jgi:hypothetical protein
VLKLYVLFELFPLFFLVCYEKIPALIEACGKSEFFVELFEGIEAGQSHTAVEFKSPLCAYACSAAACRT